MTDRMQLRGHTHGASTHDTATPANIGRRVAPRTSLTGLLVLVATLAAALAAPSSAVALGPDAVMTPPGYNVNSVARGDDTSNLVVNLPFAMNWNGTDYTQIYINMNGNCTFGTGYTGYNPSTSLAATGRNIMAPLWEDIDTRNTGASQVTYSTTTAGSIPQVDGHNAFFVNWLNVARYNNTSTPTNHFQLVLVDRSDTGAGNFDFIFNYDQVTWDIATAASTYKARAGWGFNGTGFELPGSGVTQGSASTLLDSSSAATSLVQNTLNSNGQLGRYMFQVRGGQAPNLPPTISISDVVLEGNTTNGYTGYTGAGDVTATDTDGSIASLMSDAPAVLPLGTTCLTWTATDNQGAMVTGQQYVTVVDTTPPSDPTITSPTHVTGSWTPLSTVTVDSSGATDICSGIGGFSYSWSQDTPAAPDTTTDPMVTSTVWTPDPVTVEEEPFATATWPTGWTRSDATYVRLTNATGRNHGSYAVEAWANSTTRRTVNVYHEYDLTGLASATLSYWDVTSLSGSPDAATVEYSTNGGASYTTLRTTSATGAWTARSHALPVGGVVRVRFAASVNRTTEYADWDDITVTGTIMTPHAVYGTHTTSSLADGRWYFNIAGVDNVGNWSAPVNMGPFMIDTLPPVTTDNAPAGWVKPGFSLVLTATDAGDIAYTRYRLNGGPLTAYTGAIPIIAEGTNTITYYSADTAGHIESVRTATVRLDASAPTAPAATFASATATSIAEVTWTAGTDAVSGVVAYRIYRDGSPVATSTTLAYSDIGLTPGQTYTYRVSALDAAGNESPLGPQATVTLPSSEFWISITESVVDMGSLDPEVVVTRSSATSVVVGGVGSVAYDLTCSSEDFTHTVLGALAPKLPASLLAFVTHGWNTHPLTPFSNSTQLIDASVGSPYVWTHAYTFDYSLEVPYSYLAGTYANRITYTAIVK